jgi:hypothetical protein
MRGGRACSTVGDPGLLDEELEEEACANSARWGARLRIGNETAAMAIGRCRDREILFRQTTIRIRRSP